MLAATSNGCPKGLVAFETLEAVHTKIVALPVKEKKFFKTREAVAYLFQDIHDAIVNKNYTIEDISQSFVSAGWLISQTSLKQFWRFFRAYTESYNNSTISTDKKERNEHAKTVTRKRKNLPSGKSDFAIETTSNDTKISSAVNQNNSSEMSEISSHEQEKIASLSSDENMNTDSVQPQNSAHFDLPPDSEDL